MEVDSELVEVFREYPLKQRVLYQKTNQMRRETASTGARIRYEWRSPFELPVEDMLIQGPSTFEFEGTKLRSVYGHYTWRGQHYKSYQVGVDGQIQREPE